MRQYLYYWRLSCRAFVTFCLSVPYSRITNIKSSPKIAHNNWITEDRCQTKLDVFVFFISLYIQFNANWFFLLNWKLYVYFVVITLLLYITFICWKKKRTNKTTKNNTSANEENLSFFKQVAWEEVKQVRQRERKRESEGNIFIFPWSSYNNYSEEILGSFLSIAPAQSDWNIKIDHWLLSKQFKYWRTCHPRYIFSKSPRDREFNN